MDWTPFHDALRCWAKAATEVDVIWLGEAIEEQYAPLVELQIISVGSDGEDLLRRTDPEPNNPESEQDLVESTCGTRRVMVQLRARTREYDPATWALGLLERCKATLHSSAVIAEIEAAGVALKAMSDIRVLPSGYRGRVEQYAVMEVECSVSVHEQLGTVGWFNRVRVTSDVRSVTGDALSETLQLVNEQIGPPPPEEP